MTEDDKAKKNTTYIVDAGLVTFGKFTLGIVGVLVTVGVILFGINIEEARQSASESSGKAFEIYQGMVTQQEEFADQVATLKAQLAQMHQQAARIEQQAAIAEESAAKAVRALASIEETVVFASAYRETLVQLNRTELATARAEATASDLAGELPKIWKTGSTIRYRFVGGTERERQTVRTAMEEWLAHANLTFTEVEQGGELRFGFDSTLGSWARLGTDALATPQTEVTANFGFLAQSDVYARQTALHEFGHVLGLRHEHQNPLQGPELDFEAIAAALSGPPNFWDAARLNENFRPLPESLPIEHPFDPKSVMNMWLPASFLVSGDAMEPGTHLSEGDIALVSKLYPR